jgi:hypothetical protein
MHRVRCGSYSDRGSSTGGLGPLIGASGGVCGHHGGFVSIG